MKLLKYIDFILEARGDITCPSILSNAFIQKCESIDSPISKALIDMDRELSSYTFIDISLDGKGIRYTESSRVVDYLNEIYEKSPGFNPQKYLSVISNPEPDSPLWQLNRIDIKVGRFIKRFLGDSFTDSEVENFVNKWKSSLKVEGEEFQFWSGDKIIEAYDTKNYKGEYGYNPLWNSCMNDRGDLLDFYLFVSGLEVVVLVNSVNSVNKIIGRALLWTDTEGRKLLDRVYYINDSDYNKFIGLASENGWYYKKRNISGGSTWVLSGVGVRIKCKIKYPSESISELFPYVDSFYYLDDKNGYLLNYEPSGSYYILNDTDGRYEYFSDLYDIRGNRIMEVDDYVTSKTQRGLIYYYNSEHVEYPGFDDYIELSYLEDEENGFIYDELEHQWYKKEDFEKMKSSK